MSNTPSDGEDGCGQSGQNPEGSGKNAGPSGGRATRSSGKYEEISVTQKIVIGVSVTFTVLLFTYAAWQIATPPRADVPQVSVIDTERIDNGSVAVTVKLRNPKDMGLVSATVESNCTSPPAQVEFSFVPASATRTGTLVCPSGATDPSVSMANWVTK